MSAISSKEQDPIVIDRHSVIGINNRAGLALIPQEQQQKSQSDHPDYDDIAFSMLPEVFRLRHPGLNNWRTRVDSPE